MLLKRVGYFCEMPHGEETDPSITESIHREIPNKDRVLVYLESGITFAACSMVVSDIITPQNGIIGSPDDMTDGTWIWPKDLSYYVRNYDLTLPGDFIRYMEENNWTIAVAENELDFENIEVI